jgi:hypothetical protein
MRKGSGGKGAGRALSLCLKQASAAWTVYLWR